MAINKISELWKMNASEIVQLVKDRKVSCREIVQAHIDRIKEINPGINAVTVLLEEQALNMADNEDKKLARGKKVSPLQGIPFTVNEKIDLIGSATSLGTSTMKDKEPDEDAPLIVQLKEAGAIPIARTNLSEFALRPHTENELRGATLNPWNNYVTPGGSSGGDAVAVSTGMAPLGIGNDYGGSLRLPAQLNGISTIKPSSGRVPDHLSVTQTEPLITTQFFLAQGPFARCIDDLKLALYNMSSYDGRDPHWTPADFFNVNIKSMVKIAAVYEPGGKKVEPEVREGIGASAQILIDSGYTVEEIEPPSINDAWDIYVGLTSVEKREFIIPKIPFFDSEKTASFIKYWTELIPGQELHTYMNSLAQRKRIAREWSLFMEEFPLIIGPVSTMTTLPVDFDVKDMETVNTYLDSCKFMIIANLLGLPSVVVPVGIKNGAPLAVQIIGPKFFEDLCLDAARCIEDKVGPITPITPL